MASLADAARRFVRNSASWHDLWGRRPGICSRMPSLRDGEYCEGVGRLCLVCSGKQRDLSAARQTLGGSNPLGEAKLDSLRFHEHEKAISAFPAYCSLAYSALASFRMGMLGSASFQRARKSW